MNTQAKKKTRKEKVPPFTKKDQWELIQKVFLPFAVYIFRGLSAVQKYIGPIQFGATGPYEELIQAYLTLNAKRNAKNILYGILLVLDGWSHAKGNRIHIYICGEGPIFEALGSEVVEREFVKYIHKTAIWKKIMKAVTGYEAANVKNVHIDTHLWTRSERTTIREELSRDHGGGFPNSKTAPLIYYHLRVKKGVMTWVNISAAEVETICNRVAK